jgi:hypothetical protein
MTGTEAVQCQKHKQGVKLHAHDGACAETPCNRGPRQKGRGIRVPSPPANGPAGPGLCRLEQRTSSTAALPNEERPPKPSNARA